MAASLTKIPISFYKRTLNSSVIREKQLSTLSCSLPLSTDGSEEHSGVSQRWVLLQAAQGDQTLFPGSDELL